MLSIYIYNKSFHNKIIDDFPICSTFQLDIGQIKKAAAEEAPEALLWKGLAKRRAFLF